MKDNKKSRVLFIRLIYACIAAALAASAAAAFLPSVKSVMLTVTALSCAAAAFMLFRLFGSMEKRIENAEAITENTEGYALIKYCKKTETAVISGDFQGVTGIETESSVLDETDYKKLIVDMISSPSDAGTDIYMAARPESWIKIRTYENSEFEYTMIHSVSEFVSCKNIIKSLKYYDSGTGLLSRDAFISKVRSAAGAKAGTVGLITLMIDGLDKLTSFKGTAAADRIISKAAAFVKKFENPHNVFGGRTATNEFCVLVTDTYEEGCRKYAEKLNYGLAEVCAASEGSEYIRVYCGYALTGGEDSDAGSMMSAVDYAAFEAQSSGSPEPVCFDRANYVLRAYDFKKIHVFNKVVNENLVSYHFQPVVDARTGAIFGHEALMRPHESDGITLSPPEVIEIAAKQGMTLAVEYLTLSNTIGFLHENSERFGDRKLFINAIPNCFVSEEQYNEIYGKYGDVFDKLIVEITEGVQITQKSIDAMRERYSGRGALIAMDDYGTGYANESTLITIKPDFIKIDRSLIEGIGSDVQKQHLVSNMINFARSHGIKTLGEGVETREELETLITFGVDLIQGYYTGRPVPELLTEIPADIKDEILGINLKNVGYAQKEFVLEDDAPKDIAELAVQGYTDIVVAAENVSLKSSTFRSASLRVSCPDGYKGTVNINGVSIFGLDAPSLTLGKNCDVTLNVTGENFFFYEGIRVPASSKLAIRGQGTLGIDMNNINGVVIGGNCLQDFGSISIDMDGGIKITSQAESVTAIGGGVGGENSLIEIAKGNISVSLNGISLIGVGATSGTVGIKLGKCSLNIQADGQNVVAVGSKSGKVSLDCAADAKISCSGDNCCDFGTLESGSGSMSFGSGSYDLTVHAKNAVGIGSMGGNTSVDIKDGTYNIFCEGNSAAGVGDCFGSGNITIWGGIFRMHIASSMELPIGSAKGKAVIRGGNILTDSREKIKAVSPFGEPLSDMQIDCDGKFSKKISSAGNEYTYTAEAAKNENFVSVYLPASKN